MLHHHSRRLLATLQRQVHCSVLGGIHQAAPQLERVDCIAHEADESPQDTFRYADLQITRTTTPKPLPKLEDLRFGQSFTDHMFVTTHRSGSGWDQPHIRPFGPIPLHPAAQVLHYGVSCFEGMKAYMGVDGVARLFRPEMNMARLERSSKRLLLADFDPTELLLCLKALLREDIRWLPHKPGYSIYIRPYVFSTGENLGVARSSECILSIILSPVGPYFKTGLSPVTLFLDEHHVRAWPGGVGQYKIGGNYAPTLLPQEMANRGSGTPQVVYTISPPHAEDPEDAYLSESGAMNFFCLFDYGPGRGCELVTPPLDGTILPGVTRDSVLALARQWGEFEVSERHVTIREMKQAAAAGQLREMFGCGTACVVQPVQALARSNGDVLRATFSIDDPATLARRITKELQDIQYGKVASHWAVPIHDEQR